MESFIPKKTIKVHNLKCRLPPITCFSSGNCRQMLKNAWLGKNYFMCKYNELFTSLTISEIEISIKIPINILFLLCLYYNVAFINLLIMIAFKMHREIVIKKLLLNDYKFLKRLLGNGANALFGKILCWNTV